MPTVLLALPMPAQLTTICIPPNCSTVALMQSVTESSSVTLAIENAVPSPKLSAACLALSSLRSTNIILAPTDKSFSAVAKPKPEAPPVISATLPEISIDSPEFFLRDANVT